MGVAKGFLERQFRASKLTGTFANACNVVFLLLLLKIHYRFIESTEQSELNLDVDKNHILVQVPGGRECLISIVDVMQENGQLSTFYLR